MLNPVNSPPYYKYVIAGAGPTGLTVLKELLTSGVSSREILIIDSYIPAKITKNLTQEEAVTESIFEISRRESNSGGTGKGGTDFLSEGINQKSDAYNWGTACNLPTKKLIEKWGLNYNQFLNHYKETEKFFKVNTLSNSELPRKAFASWVVNKNNAFKHSQLAIETGNSSFSCKLSGNCFTKCPNNAPTTPEKLYQSISTVHGEQNFLNETIDSINVDSKLIYCSKKTVSYSCLILTTGAVSSLNLLSSASQSKLKMFATNVSIVPFFTIKPIKTHEFYKHFKFNDLTFSLQNNELTENFIQVYLPSSEIAGRILTQLPKLLKIAYKVIHEAILFKFFCHLGIAMIFHAQTEVSEKKIFKKLSLISKLRIQKKFLSVGFFLIPFVSRRLVNGSSRHFGGIHGENDLEYGFKSKIWESFAEKGCLVLDSLILPDLQPGPHTLHACTLAKMTIHERLLP